MTPLDRGGLRSHIPGLPVLSLCWGSSSRGGDLQLTYKLAPSNRRLISSPLSPGHVLSPFPTGGAISKGTALREPHGVSTAWMVDLAEPHEDLSIKLWRSRGTGLSSWGQYKPPTQVPLFIQPVTYPSGVVCPFLISVPVLCAGTSAGANSLGHHSTAWHLAAKEGTEGVRTQDGIWKLQIPKKGMRILIFFSYLIFYGPRQLPILTHNAKIYADLIINLLLLATGYVKISEEKACWNFPFFPHCYASLFLKLGNQTICFFY